MANYFKFGAMVGAVLTVVLAVSVPASAQYYPAYGYSGPVYRTMPVRPVPPAPTYRTPYARPYVQPYPTRPTYPVPPVSTPRIDQRADWGSGMPYRPGVTPTCRGARSTGVCYGGQRPGVY